MSQGENSEHAGSGFRGAGCPVSLTYQEIPEREGFRYFMPLVENTRLVSGIICEINGPVLLKSQGLGDQAVLRARAEAAWRENVEARSSFTCKSCPPPYIKKRQAIPL